MQLPFYIDLETLQVISIALSLFTLVVVFFVFFRIWRVLTVEKKLASEERKIRLEISAKIGEVAATHLQGMTAESTVKLDHEVRKFTEELERLMHARSAEVTAMIEKAQTDQIKESQFFVANLLTKLEKEAQEYKENKLKAVDEQIRQIVLSAAREVIGRSISLTEHEDLVVKALERAKREKVFS